MCHNLFNTRFDELRESGPVTFVSLGGLPVTDPRRDVEANRDDAENGTDLGDFCRALHSAPGLELVTERLADLVDDVAMLPHPKERPSMLRDAAGRTPPSSSFDVGCVSA